MESEEGQLTVLQTLERMIEQHVQDFSPYVLSDLEEKAKVNHEISWKLQITINFICFFQGF
jgi:hypothetical protein